MLYKIKELTIDIEEEIRSFEEFKNHFEVDDEVINKFLNRLKYNINEIRKLCDKNKEGS